MFSVNLDAAERSKAALGFMMLSSSFAEIVFVRQSENRFRACCIL